MHPALAPEALDQLFRTARTHNGFSGPVTDDDLRRIFDLMKWGPTSANSCPARFVFVRTPAAKAKLKPCLDPGNVAKTMEAPVTALVGYDLAFYEHLPRLFPHADARSWFVGNEALTRHAAFLNAALQGAYLIVAARALGFDCGPMSGFDSAKADAAFFSGTQVKSFMLVNLGQGDPSKLYPRGPRFAFDEVCRVA
jgi:3-hydroxypropanoate dehydrogenase